MIKKKSLYDFTRKKFLDEEEIEINSMRDASGNKWFTLNGVDLKCDNDVFCNRFDLGILRYLKVNNDIFLVAFGACNEALDEQVSFQDIRCGYPKGNQVFIKKISLDGLHKICKYYGSRKRSLRSVVY